MDGASTNNNNKGEKSHSYYVICRYGSFLISLTFNTHYTNPSMITNPCLRSYLKKWLLPIYPKKTAAISLRMTSGFPENWRQRNERRNSILMTRHYPDMISASDWLKQFWSSQNHYPSLSSDASFAGKPAVASRNVGCFLRLFVKTES